MAVPHQYRQLLDEIQQLTLVPEALLSPELTHLNVRGVDFSLYPVGDQGQEHVVTHCDLGALPDKAREEAMLRLLDTNFQLVNAAKPVTFCRNEHSGHMMLSMAQPLSSLTGQSILDQMGTLADYALVWRQTFFLDKAAPKPQPSSTAQLPRTFSATRAF
ncbi:Tir chaperone protein (CesT) family protein [Pseudomonas flavescens]|uniref:Tir chaperone protein (CesT) family protein n=1 Tax=Phytopseudomonas flavescens TaxID=29435 RepID=A0A1G8DJ69_9GAMM|nr:CesT family type III secretion system chaperone [Pseudomonas flavescens]SDH57723.1 Tir chaperone protein (CesT) family protein [Pseudomonas flavescens]